MVGLTALTFLFAVWSWWSSNKSKKARLAAEDAGLKANRRVEAAETTASELRKLVESLQMPPLVATVTSSRGSKHIMIRNTTREPIKFSAVLNQDDFVRLDIDEKLPFTIPPGAQLGVTALGAYGYPVPSNLHLQIQDIHGERDVHVPIPPTP